MGLLFLDQANMAQLGPIRFWAERGLICVEDSREINGKAGGFHTETVREMLERLQAGQDMIKNSRFEPNVFYNHFGQIEELQQFLEKMVPVIRLAQEQGQPDDPTCRPALKAARKKTFIMPGDVAF